MSLCDLMWSFYEHATSEISDGNTVEDILHAIAQYAKQSFLQTKHTH